MSIAARLVAESASLARDVRGAVRGHDLTLISAGTTFYLAIAVVPLLLVAIRLASLLVGPDRIQRLGAEVALLLPSTLGADRATRGLIDVGSELSWSRVLLSLLPASLYGEGLRRAFLRLSPQQASGARTAWQGRALAIAVLPLSPLLTVAALLGAVGIANTGGRGAGGTLLGGYLAFLATWVLVSVTLVVQYRGLAPDRPRWPALLLGAFGTGSFVAGFLLGFLIFMQIPVAIGSAYGGYDAAAAVAVAGGWVLLLHALVLVGYATTLQLDARRSRLGGRPPVSWPTPHPRTKAPTR